MIFYGTCPIVIDFLYPADRFALKTVSFHKEIKTKQILYDIKDIIITKLATSFTSRQFAELLITKMHYHNIVLSGSFLLQCLIGEDWDNSDIDLYFVATSTNSSDFNAKKLLNELHVHGFSQWLIDEGWETSMDVYPELPIRSILYFPRGKSYDDNNDYKSKAINMIQIYPQFDMTSTFHKQYYKFYPFIIVEDGHYWFKSKSVRDYVGQTSDMQFLKNIYDGEICNVANWDSIVQRKTHLESFKSVYVRECSRYSDCSKSFIHRMNKRMEKYESRGFELIWKNEFHQYYFESHLRHCGKQNQYYDSDVDEKHVPIKSRKSIEERVELQNAKHALKFDRAKQLSWYITTTWKMTKKKSLFKLSPKMQRNLEIHYCVSILLNHKMFSFKKTKWGKIVFKRV